MAITAMAIAAVAAPIVGGVIGNLASEGDRRKAREAQARAVATIEAVGAGPDLARRIYMQEFSRAGVLTPEMEEAVNVGVSEVSKITEDPKLREAQTTALDMMRQRAQTGMSPEDRARIAQIQQEVAAQEEGRRQQILQNFAARGQGGAGAELLAALTGGQAATNRAAQESLQVAGQASQNALSALSNYGNMSGQVRGQDFDVNRARAQAADEFRRFDVQNLLGVNQRNVGSRNQAQQFNLENLQNIMNRNVETENQERRRQRDAEQQMYLNRMNQATALANALSGQATNLQQQAQQTAQMWSGVGKGVGEGAGAGAGFMQNQQRLDLDQQRLALEQQRARSGSGG